MENSINKVVLSGVAGADVEVKLLTGKQRVAKVNLAVHESFRNTAGEVNERTNWFHLTFWNDKADLASELIKKGSKVSIEGRLKTGSYEAKDGSKRYTTEIVVNEVQLLN